MERGGREAPAAITTAAWIGEGAARVSKGWRAALVVASRPVTERRRCPRRGASRSSDAAGRGSWATFGVWAMKSRKEEKEEDEARRRQERRSEQSKGMGGAGARRRRLSSGGRKEEGWCPSSRARLGASHAQLYIAGVGRFWAKISPASKPTCSRWQARWR